MSSTLMAMRSRASMLRPLAKPSERTGLGLRRATTFFSVSGAPVAVTGSASFGALAGMTMIVAYRHSVIAGPLIALAIVPAAAMVGVALAAGEPALVYQGAERFILDVVLIVVWGALVVALEQASVHRRKPMV